MNTRKVSYNKIRRKMRALVPHLKQQINRYILDNWEYIDHFEYGHVKGVRRFVIVKKNGHAMVWDAFRN